MHCGGGNGELLTLLVCVLLEKAMIYTLVTEKNIYVVTRDLGYRPFSSIKYLHEPELSLLMQNYDAYSYLSQRFMRT